MNADYADTSLAVSETAPPRIPRGINFVQAFLGICTYSLFCLPYVRKIHGLERLDPSKRYLLASNHVSLLDTILLGGLAWRSGNYPILVLGDKHVWHASWIKRALSRHIGFLLDRSRLNPGRIKELKAFGRSANFFNLVVYPEGTRGDGVHVGPCQPGIYYIAQEAQVPIVPMFISNMQRVSTKGGRFHPIGGLRKIEVYFGVPIPPEEYLGYSREEFCDFIRERVQQAPARRPAAHLIPALPQV